MTASLFNIIMVSVLAIIVTAGAFIALVRGWIAEILDKMGMFKKRVRLDDHEKHIS